MIRFVLFALSLCAAAAAQAQVYKCLDANGRTVYRQDPCPPSMKREAMTKPVVPPDAPAAASAASGGKSDAKGGPKTPAEQEQAFRKRQQDAAKSAKEAAQKNEQAQVKEANCSNARQRLAQYEIGGRISRIDAQGERYYMDDASIESAKSQAQADVSKFCN
ncbi:MAG TPA: DUF4124 domain-containing protein [Burkholderiales bacterium]|nr:DUF4124 domain-containing protein [Burkholderiales bacterium]